MMKKISFKGLKLPTQRRARAHGDTAVAGHEGETASQQQQQHEPPQPQQQQQPASRPRHADDGDGGHRKKEKKGLLRNLRRCFTPTLRRKNDCGEPNHIEERQKGPESKRGKQKGRQNFLGPEKSVRTSSTTTDSDCNAQNATVRKLNELHSNTDGSGPEGTPKGVCLGKDISKFQTEDCVNVKSDGSEDAADQERELEHESRGCERFANTLNNERSVLTCGWCPLAESDPTESVGPARNSNTYESCDVTQILGPGPPLYNEVKELPKVWSLTQELFRLSKFGWYWGPITRVEAEEKLANQSDGAFLVRDSSDERYLLSLSFRSYGRTLHTRIEHCNGMFSFYAQPDTEGYPSIVDLIEHSMNDSQTGIFCYYRSRSPGAPSFPVRLTKPVSRFTQVRSLQYLCRFVIRQYIRVDHIQQLPLPNRIKGWIEENQY